MPYASANAIQIAYDDSGSGEPALLMMPGWCANRTVYQDLAPLCAAHRRTLALDWQGHGESGKISADFGERDLVENALCVIRASGARHVIPVALAHSNWVAIELRRRLGERIPKIVLLECIVFDAPPPFLEALKGMQSPERWSATVDNIFALWLQGVDNQKLERFVRLEMASYGFDMWSRAAREIAAAYSREGNPLRALKGLKPPLPVLHLYTQPDSPHFLAEQQSFAAEHPWFRVQRLKARSHFPMFEIPREIAEAIQNFVG